MPLATLPRSATRTQGNFTLTFHASGRLRIDNAYLLEHVRERDAHLTAVTNHIVRSKWNYQFTRELSARVILQYNAVLSNPDISSLSRTKNFNADFLITYLIHPGTAIYVGYNSDLENLDRNLARRPRDRLYPDHAQWLHQRRPPVLREGVVSVPVLRRVV